VYKFKIRYDGNIFQSEVIYRDYEYSFDCEPNNGGDITLVIGDYIQLKIWSSNMMTSCVYGLSGYHSWKKIILNPPTYKKGRLILMNYLEPGAAVHMKESATWESKFDYNNGWFCIGNDSTSEDDSSVEFTINTVAVIDKNRYLKALWWKPKFRSEFNLKSALKLMK
jgi:hypothetical protein